jgi:hypothetical protein
VLAVDPADYQPAGLVHRPGWHLDAHEILPEFLRPDEVDPVLLLLTALLVESNSNFKYYTSPVW